MGMAQGLGMPVFVWALRNEGMRRQIAKRRSGISLLYETRARLAMSFEMILKLR
jgi:hypothetical protein